MPGDFNQERLSARFEGINQRLREIESQLAVLSERAGVAYEEPTAEVPEDVVELARAGKTIEAVKRYRELTNASADDAREVVARL
jgi:ribosomal protein L7/L12